MKNFLHTYYILINIVLFLVWGIDKLRAQAGRWRVAEKTLLGGAAAGGAFGALAGMLIFRHKTRKPLFRVGVAAACVLHAVILISIL